MSYCYRMAADVFYIPRENVGKALDALRNRQWDGLEFAERPERVRGARSLQEIIAVFGLSTVQAEDGSLDGLAIEDANWSDQEALFDTLAPFIGEGSEINFLGEDGASWSYLFDGKGIKKEYC